MVRGLARLILPIGLLGAACTQVAEFKPPPAATPTLAPHLAIAEDQAPRGGEVFVALPHPQYLFGPHFPQASVTAATRRARDLLGTDPRLTIEPLLSTPSTVALALRESVSGDQRWGEVMIPAERRLFAGFAGDPSLGRWLILITDVDVSDGPDPVPLTAYRWDRGAVEHFAACGIPPSGFDACTDGFFVAAETQMLIASGSHPQQ
jgi:hypothetical protein